MRFTGRLFVLAALAATAVAARADGIILDSFGTWSGDGSAWTQIETVLYPPSNTGSFPALTLLTADVTGDGHGNGISAVATYTNGSGDSLILDWTVTDNQYNGNAFSMDGTWTYAGGTGGYDPSHIASGLGTFAVSETNTGSGGVSGTVLIGDLYPTPEPATMAALGMGVLALARRRRKA